MFHKYEQVIHIYNIPLGALSNESQTGADFDEAFIAASANTLTCSEPLSKYATREDMPHSLEKQTGSTNVNLSSIIILENASLANSGKTFEPKMIKVRIGVNNTVQWINKDNIPYFMSQIQKTTLILLLQQRMY